LNNSQHVDCGLIQLNEDTIVNLNESKQLKNLSHLWTYTIDTETKQKTQTKQKGLDFDYTESTLISLRSKRFRRVFRPFEAFFAF